MLTDIANEERVHAGEFLRLIEKTSGDEATFMEKGAREVDKKTQNLQRRSLSKSERQATGKLELLADSPEYLTQTIEDIGYRDKVDNAFQEAIARAKGRKGD